MVKSTRWLPSMVYIGGVMPLSMSDSLVGASGSSTMAKVLGDRLIVQPSGGVSNERLKLPLAL